MTRNQFVNQTIIEHGIFYGTSGPGFGNQGDRAPWVAFNPALAVADIDDDGTYEVSEPSE